jgi:hypothetical protein
METVGELTTLQAGESASLIESWELFAPVPDIHNEEDVDRYILPLVTGA